jgi:hypothetical protein
LNSIAQGVYQRPDIVRRTAGNTVDWLAVVASIQCLMGYDVHIGGKTALTIHGFEHYLKFGLKDPAYLYGDAPGWLNRVSSNRKFQTRSCLMFKQSKLGVGESTDLTDLSKQTSVVAPGDENWAISVSLPERAILEMLAELPNRETFELVDKTFEGLFSLRPDLLQELLKICSSVKVKRYFMVFGERHNHSWWKYLSPERVNLGSGPRQTFKGGKIHPRYLISVPPEIMESENEDYRDGP